VIRGEPDARERARPVRRSGTGRPTAEKPHGVPSPTQLLKAIRDSHTRYVSGLVDTATGRLLDVVADRTARAVTGWLAQRNPAWLSQIGLVSLDPHRGYANAVGVHLGHATLVVDHFHVIRVRHEAPCCREGCKDPPAVCRSRPLKLGAA